MKEILIISYVFFFFQAIISIRLYRKNNNPKATKLEIGTLFFVYFLGGPLLTIYYIVYLFGNALFYITGGIPK